MPTRPHQTRTEGGIDPVQNKLVAANYLPAISAALPQPSSSSSASAPSRQPASAPADPQALLAGRTYPFHLAITSPLYGPAQVRLTTQPAPTVANERSPFEITLPSATFPVAAFAEAWEYEDDEDMFDLDYEELGIGRGGGEGIGARIGEQKAKTKSKTVGVLEKKANVTVVGGEVMIGKSARGEVKFNMLVSYTYRSDDLGPDEHGSHTATPSRRGAGAKAPELKTFSFSTVVDLGRIIPREEVQQEADG